MIGAQKPYFRQGLHALVATAGTRFTFFYFLLRMHAEVKLWPLHRGNFKSARELHEKKTETEAVNNFPAGGEHTADPFAEPERQ
ncbi:hypothetical protein Turpa_0599 [Turneriella parva DSM 21527]|uniref:Uncharacterized protein n=1 Tax=Turneriella parva (strain ATCC BAA-1111 / DSM 21527 / NCTC 11395 / H) TaxID=869212 RepID=I4B1U4_TURPD|nr:hypothetical protein Turpa_0599 [Turneriella parva DSM 21527]